MQRRSFLVTVGAAVAAAPRIASAQKPIKVGMPMPLSGPPALFGEPATKGARISIGTTPAAQGGTIHSTGALMNVSGTNW
jgi:ABC-type branched-subunit amino acid transport system substrate-binding protein